jgi:ATP-binding cassette subfamily C (CFTR/MRP) protein 1
MRSIRPSLLLNIYLFFTFLFDIERSRSYALTPELSLVATVYATRLAVKLFLAVVECRDKRKHLLPEYADCPPEATSGIYKRASFWWLNALFKKGFSNALTVDDLFHLDKFLRADYMHHALGSAWARGKSTLIILVKKFIDLLFVVVSNPSPNALFTMTVGRLKWSILAVVPPRLCLIGFNFCQPFLINRAVKFSQEAPTPQAKNIGYGLIGAYIIVFVGIAVCAPFGSEVTCMIANIAPRSLRANTCI